MKAIPRIVILSLIVFSTTWVSMASAEEAGVTTLTTPVPDPVAGQTRLHDTVGYAMADPFGPIFHVEGNFGDGLGYDTGYWGGGLMLPYFNIPGRGMTFFSVQGAGAEDGAVVNLGLGYRQYARGWDRIFGISGWLDFDSGHEESYTRGGISFESLGKYIDLRANGYFLFDDDSEEISNSFTGDPFFRENFIIALRQIITEIPYHGADFEVGGPLPFLGRYGVYGHAGAYYLDAKDFDASVGFKTRIDVAATEDISINVNMSNDDIFGFNTNVSVAWQFPDGRAERFFKPRPVRERLSSQVVRQERIPVRLERDVEPEALINPDDSEPFFVIHTDPNRTAGTGDGTFENPFGSFEQARLINNPEIDIFRVVPRTDGSGTNLVLNGPFVLFGTANTGFVQQRVLSSAVEHTILAEQGLFDFPGFTGGSLPIVSNSANNPGSGVFVLANNNEISGFEINGIGGNGVINTAPIVDWNLNRNEFVNHINAVALTNSTGLGLFTDNVMTGTPGTSDNGLLILNNLAGTLNLVASDNEATLHDVAGFSVAANVNPAAVINAEFTDNTANENFNGFAFRTEGGEINLEFDGNTASENTGNLANSGGFTATSTGGSINVDSFSDNVLTDNVGNGASFEAVTGAGGGTIVVRGFNGNEITGNGDGNTTVNLANGVRILANGATSLVDAEIGNLNGDGNIISNNGLGIGGGHGIRIETQNDGTVQGAIQNNVITNHDFGQGISVDANGGVVDFGTLPNRLIASNLIDGNTDAGISVLLRDDAVGRFAIISNQITGTVNGTNPNLDGEGIHVRLESNSELELLTIESNLIGVDLAGNDLGNAGDGIEIELFQNSQAPDINILSNIVRFNNEDGIHIFRGGDAFLDDVLIDGNTLSDNSGSGLELAMQGGDINLNGGGPLVIDYTITDNFMNNNAIDGMTLTAIADADVRILFDNNQVVGNDRDGMHLETDFFAQIRGDISNNIITDNGDGIGENGIHLVDLNNGDVSFDLDIESNLIARNFDDGVNYFAAGAGTAVVDLIDNIIRTNGGDGVDASTNLNSVASINLVDNLIEFNSESGVEFQANDLSILNTTSTGNIIQNNGDDGWSFTTGAGSIANLNASLTDNIIRFNAARGIDILNQWESDMDIEILGTVDPRPNGNVDSSLIDSNGLQGILVQNEADATRSNTNGLFTNNNIDFRLFQTEVRGNGVNAVADDDGNGLYIRVGTSQFGQVDAAVVNNHFSGNVNIDVVTESFTATVDPPVVNPFTNPADFVPDPLARLNFRLQGNVGQQIDVTRVGAFYDNVDEFKSVAGAFNTTDPTGRRRNAQREADDVDLFDGLPLSVDPADLFTVTAGPPVPAEGTFAIAPGVPFDGWGVNAIGTFVNGPNNGVSRQVDGSDPADNTVTFSEDFPAIPNVGDDLTLIAIEQSGVGASTFRTEDASVTTNNQFDTVISDFGTVINFIDADPDEAPYPYTWTTGLVFPPIFP